MTLSSRFILAFLAFVAFFAAAFFLPHGVSAAASCAFQPFTTTIAQGESAALSVTVTLPDTAASYELKLGNMPLSVSSGFSQINAGTSTVKNVSLLISSKPDAQTGSFMIPVLCRISSGGAISESIEQFNLVVIKAEKKSASLAQPPAQSAPSVTSQTVSSGTAAFATSSALKTSFDLSVKKAASTSATVTNKGRIISGMQRGSRGAQVMLLQEMLQTLKFFPADVAPTGYFGAITKEAVEKFQESKGIERIGIVGPKTRAVLNANQ